MHETPHKSPRREDHSLSTDLHLKRSLDALHLIALNQDGCNIPLVKIQPFCPLNRSLNPKLIRFLIALSTRCSNGWTLARVQHAPLNGSRICIFPHDPTKCINLSNHVSFRQASNRWVTTHLTNCVKILSQHCHRNTKPSSS